MSNSFGEKFESFVRIFISAIMAYIMFILFFSSMFSTTDMQIVYDDQAVDNVVMRIFPGDESVIYHYDDVFINFIMLAFFGMICFLILPKLKRLSLKQEMILISIWTIFIGCFWVNSSMVAPTYDSAYVVEYAKQFAKDNYAGMEEVYLKEFPYQLGYVFLVELLTKIYTALFGEPTTTIYIQKMNVVFLALIYDGIIFLNHVVFEEKKIRNMTFLLLFFCTQSIISCTFTYGIIPAFAFSVWAIALEVLYFKKKRFWLGLLSAISLMFAVMFKNNNYIVMIAMLIIAFVQIIKEKFSFQRLAYMMISAVLALGILPAVTSYYEQKSHISLGDSVPYISWISMGMCESTRAPGWCNALYTTMKFEELGMNAESMKEYSEDLLQERLTYFKENPQYRKDFFYRKFTSQWNETSYQSIWNNLVREQYQLKGKFAELFCYKQVDSLKAYMDFYAQLIFFGCLLAVLACFRNKNFFAVAMPLVILGGVLYHLLSEAKSQYALPYFILMIGVSAYGLCLAYDAFSRKMQSSVRFAHYFST